MDTIEGFIETMMQKDHRLGFEALNMLLEMNENSSILYAYADTFIPMMEHQNAYIRIRGIKLTIAIIKWDEYHSLDSALDKILSHIHDNKPIVARQCIQSLPTLNVYQPSYKAAILRALKHINLDAFPQSMQSLIMKDVDEATSCIKKEGI